MICTYIKLNNNNKNIFFILCVFCIRLAQKTFPFRQFRKFAEIISPQGNLCCLKKEPTKRARLMACKHICADKICTAQARVEVKCTIKPSKEEIENLCFFRKYEKSLRFFVTRVTDRVIRWTCGFFCWICKKVAHPNANVFLRIVLYWIETNEHVIPHKI